MGWMIYGANGYTGNLIAREAKRRGARPVLAGRSAGKIGELAAELSLSIRIFSLDLLTGIEAGIKDIDLILDCAGPFSKTAEPLIRACLAAKVHYLDITGEIDILERAHRLDDQAKAAGIVLCPGVGFDVTPTDCIALMLKTALPDAHELSLGFESDHRVSQGTVKTAVEALGKSGKVRRSGCIVELPMGSGCRTIDFGRGPKRAMPIPWGDVDSARYTTGVPNITVYTPVSLPVVTIVSLMTVCGAILRSPRLQNWLSSLIESTMRGPDAAMRDVSPTWLWGELRNPSGQSKQMRIRCLNGYSLTVLCALAVVERVVADGFEPGCWTEARIMGADFILSVPGTVLLDQTP